MITICTDSKSNDGKQELNYLDEREQFKICKHFFFAFMDKYLLINFSVNLPQVMLAFSIYLFKRYQDPISGVSKLDDLYIMSCFQRKTIEQNIEFRRSQTLDTEIDIFTTAENYNLKKLYQRILQANIAIETQNFDDKKDEFTVSVLSNIDIHENSCLE